MENPQTTYTKDDIPALLAEINRLKAENTALRNEKADMEMMMEMASTHADDIGSDLLEKVDASIKEIEERVRIISETIPVPILIVEISGGKIVYANELSCSVFELSHGEILTHKASEFYGNPSDRQKFVDIMNQEGYVSNFQTRFKKPDGSIFWAALFSRPLNFKNEPCVLTVIYDLTERRHAEEEIHRLMEELNQKEEKYLIFSLAGQDFGIHLLKVKEIIGNLPLRSVPNVPDYVKGVINLRGKIIPVTDLRRRFGFESADYTDRSGIILIESEDKTEKRPVGILVDSVTEILGIKKKDIALPPEHLMGKASRFLSGMAKVSTGIKIILDTEKLQVYDSED
ncbi:MAG: chemotaxis protein CheW [Desulfococcaceae bacterium]